MCPVLVNEIALCPGNYYDIYPCKSVNACRNGTIKVHNYENNIDQNWIIDPDCAMVHIWSEFINIEPAIDFLVVNNVGYTGTEAIDQLIPANFTVTFLTDSFGETTIDDGFVLNWICKDKL